MGKWHTLIALNAVHVKEEEMKEVKGNAITHRYKTLFSCRVSLCFDNELDCFYLSPVRQGCDISLHSGVRSLQKQVPCHSSSRSHRTTKQSFGLTHGQKNDLFTFLKRNNHKTKGYPWSVFVFTAQYSESSRVIWCIHTYMLCMRDFIQPSALSSCFDLKSAFSFLAQDFT